MTTIDTLKLKLPADAILGWDAMKFKKTGGSPVVNGEKVGGEDWRTGQIAWGIKDISINESTGKAILSCSAKALGSKYLDGISIDTYEQLIDAINGTGAITICADTTFSDAEVLSCDASNNIPVSDRFETLQAISNIHTSYDKKTYPLRGNRVETVMFTRQVITTALKDRQRHYDKYTELQGSSNKKFIQSMPDGGASMMRQCAGIVRVESMEVSLEGIRKTFGVTSNKLSMVLTSTANIHGARFKRIEKMTPQLELFDSVVAAADNFDKYDNFVKYIGMRAIVEACDGDLRRIKSILSRFNLNVSRSLKSYHPYIHAYHLQENAPSISKIHLDAYRDALNAA